MSARNSIKKILVPILIVGFGIVIAVIFYNLSTEPLQKTAEARVILVDALRVRQTNVTMTVKTQGEVLAKTRTNLVSEVSGVIVEISENYVAGGAFKQGDTLIRIDDRNYVADVKKARAAIATAETRLAEERGLAEYAAIDWSRTNRGKAKQASDLALRKPQIAEAQTNLEFVLADLVRRKGDLDRTSVTAFYDGVVESKDADLGQYVTPGTKLGVVFSIDFVEVRLPIPLHELEFLQLPEVLSPSTQAVPVTFSSLSGKSKIQWQGVITRTEAVMDRKNRVLYAVAQVANPYSTGETGWQSPLRVGSFVNAEIQGRRYSNIILIPRAAIRPGNKIWIIDDESKLLVRKITPLRADERYLYIENGLKDGDILSITPLENPLPGTKVRYRLVSEQDLLSSRLSSRERE